MKNFLASLATFLAFATLLAQTPKSAEDLSGYRQIYQDRLTEIDKKHLALAAKAPLGYANALTFIEQAFIKKGDLDGVVAIREEVARFAATKAISNEAVVTSPAELKALQQKFQATQELLEGAKLNDISKLNSAYLIRLEELKKVLTQAAKVDDALLVKEEITSIYATGIPPEGEPQITKDETTTEAEAVDRVEKKSSVQSEKNPIWKDTSAEFILIPAGVFQMGDASDAVAEAPVRRVMVNAFYMAQHETTKALWDEVSDWAASRGYTDLPVGDGKAPEHPVCMVSWFDVIKWCNARSEKEGLTPCYTVGGLTMMTGENLPEINWKAKGYRLPTEAEWEKAARGGLKRKRFPWGDTISHSQANYNSSEQFAYDISLTRGTHPTYAVGAFYASPVGSLAANAYGLYDVAGNVWEYCWDWYGTYASGSQIDPKGSATGMNRVARGGSSNRYADLSRVSFRGRCPPANKSDSEGTGSLGFRLARGR